MKILSITAQKPHSTGSGTYLTELVKAFDRMGHQQAVVCGIYPDDPVDFPEGVGCYPVFFSKEPGVSDKQEPDLLAAPCKIPRAGTAASRKGPQAGAAVSYTSPAGRFGALPFPIVGMSDIMPYESTRYRDLTPGMISQFEEAFIGTGGKKGSVETDGAAGQEGSVEKDGAAGQEGSAGNAGAVRRAIEDLDPDLIICHHLFLLTALVRKHFPEKRIIGISHGTDLRQMVNCDNLRELVRPHIAGLDMALALHEEQRSQIMELFGFDGSKAAVIGSGYNDMLFNTEGRIERRPGEPVRICYAGKISRPKGVPEMLKALSMLADESEVPPFELTMAGGCQDDVLKDMMEDLPPWADWLGQIPQPALAELLRRTDIFVLPSYFEGLPLVLIEAMASGAVPVGTDLPGVRPWILANVGHPNVIYADMPEMKSIDEPTDAGRDAFTIDLAAVLKEAMLGFESGALPGVLPDTSAITWDGLARRLLALCPQ